MRDGVATVRGGSAGRGDHGDEHHLDGARRGGCGTRRADLRDSGLQRHDRERHPESPRDVRLRLRSASGPLPKVFKFKLTGADANVIAVDDLNVASWKQDGDTLEITGAAASSTRVEFHFTILEPAPDGEGCHAS